MQDRLYQSPRYQVVSEAGSLSSLSIGMVAIPITKMSRGVGVACLERVEYSPMAFVGLCVLCVRDCKPVFVCVYECMCVCVSLFVCASRW